MFIMRLSSFILALTAVSTNAQYFSAGWSPGQAIPKPEDASLPPVPQKPAAKSPEPFLTGLLKSETSTSLFSRFGINITQILENNAAQNKVWDTRVPLITDNNFYELIVDETLTTQEEQDRTWVIVISVTTGKQDGFSVIADELFDTAYNETVIANDLPNVRWGRIDYLTVTGVTTKWAIWNAPYFVVLKNRGQTLRFYRPHHLRLKSSALREFLTKEEWRNTPPWSSRYAPGGDLEYLMDYLAIVLTKIYDFSIFIPRWLMLLISGSVASVIINFLHKPSATATPSTVQQKTSSGIVPSSTEAQSSATSSNMKVTQRKKVKERN